MNQYSNKNCIFYYQSSMICTLVSTQFVVQHGKLGSGSEPQVLPDEQKDQYINFFIWL